MEWVALLIILVVVFAIISDRRRRVLEKFKEVSIEQNMDADDLGPSHTGRYRVQQMLQKTEGWKPSLDNSSEEE